MSELKKEIRKRTLKDVLYDDLQDQMYNINNTIEELRGLQESCLSAFNNLEKDVKSLLKVMKGVINDFNLQRKTS